MTSSRFDRRAQAGAVNALWLISIMILWAGTLALLYSANAEIAAADAGRDLALADRAETDTRYDAQRVEYKDLSDLVGYNDPANPASFSAAGAAQVDLDAAKRAAGNALGGDESKVTLEAAVKALISKVAGLNNQVTALTQQAKAAEEARDGANSRLASIESTYKSQVESLRQDLEDEQKRSASQASGFERRIADLTDQQSASDATARDLQKNLDEVQAAALRDAATADAQLAAIALKRAPIAPEQPDGEILGVADSGTVAWINLGRQHGLQEGTRFEVLRRGKGGALDHRGNVVVQEVEGEMARVALDGKADLFDPILKGDLVRSPFFSAREALHYYLLGEFPLSSSKELVTSRLAALGGTVDSELTALTDVLVLGQKNLAEGEYAIELEETAEYRHAEKLGMRIVRLDSLKSFLSY